MIPPLDKRGLLPEGIYDATLSEIKNQFATTQYRQMLFNNLRLFLDNEVNDNTLPTYIAGSYLSDKELPSDIEITIPLNLALLTTSNGQKIYSLNQKHDYFKSEYLMDFYAFPDINGNPCDFRLFFQYVGIKTALAKGLEEKDKRGIIRIML